MRFASCMAPNADPFFIETVEFIAGQLGIEADIAHDVGWELRERDLDSGNVEVGWICGLPYVWKADLPDPGVELLAAPVMRAGRYAGQPIYFSDVMVRADSKIENFTDLRDRRWAFNEPRSHSGFNVVKAHLFDLGITSGFFGSAHAAGSHENALTMIVDGHVDGAAIDTTVYETLIRAEPDIDDDLKSVYTLGPSPMPPWVISTRVDHALREQFRKVLAQMHKDDHGVNILRRYDIDRFEVVSDEYYDPIRNMDRKARQVQLARDGKE